MATWQSGETRLCEPGLRLLFAAIVCCTFVDTFVLEGKSGRFMDHGVMGLAG